MLIESQYFPCILFWAKALENKELTLESQEHYQKKSYRNKCRILGANNVQTLSIPLSKGKHSSKPIREVKISDVDSWQNQHVQAIRSAYGSSPYFEFYWDDIEELIRTETQYLYEFNYNIVKYFCKMYQINLNETMEYKQVVVNDYRQRIVPSAKLPEMNIYDQVFASKHEFAKNLSILDLLFCLGPESKIYLNNLHSAI